MGNCDNCAAKGITVPATCDVKTKMGPWAFLCDACRYRLAVKPTAVKPVKP